MEQQHVWSAGILPAGRRHPAGIGRPCLCRRDAGGPPARRRRSMRAGAPCVPALHAWSAGASAALHASILQCTSSRTASVHSPGVSPTVTLTRKLYVVIRVRPGTVVFRVRRLAGVQEPRSRRPCSPSARRRSPSSTSKPRPTRSVRFAMSARRGQASTSASPAGSRLLVAPDLRDEQPGGLDRRLRGVGVHRVDLRLDVAEQRAHRRPQRVPVEVPDRPAPAHPRRQQGLLRAAQRLDQIEKNRSARPSGQRKALGSHPGRRTSRAPSSERRRCSSSRPPRQASWPCHRRHPPKFSAYRARSSRGTNGSPRVTQERKPLANLRAAFGDPRAALGDPGAVLGDPREAPWQSLAATLGDPRAAFGSPRGSWKGPKGLALGRSKWMALGSIQGLETWVNPRAGLVDPRDGLVDPRAGLGRSKGWPGRPKGWPGRSKGWPG